MNRKELKKYGFDHHFFTQYKKNKSDDTQEFPARVIARMGDVYTLQTENGIVLSKTMGKFIYNVEKHKDFPVVGDFVIAKRLEGAKQNEITKVLDRKNVFSRKMPISGGRKLHKGMIDGGVTEEQVLAANIDYLLILCGLDNNFNVSRLERYLILAKRSNLQTIIVLTKLDLCPDYLAYVEQVKEVAEDIEIIGVSSVTGEGLDALSKYVQPEKTIALLGSSGVGKSTLLNTILDEEVQKTNLISDHSGKGKHTTTHRQMFIHPSGCMMIDTPGIKELQLWADEEDLALIYPDIIELTDRCRYNNCSHGNEKDCAINEAIESGALSMERLMRYKKMLTEVRRLSERKKEYSIKTGKRGTRI